MKKADRKSVKKKLVIGMVSLSVSICILCGAVSTTILYKSSVSNMKDSTSLASTSYAQVVKNKIQQYTLAIQQVAKDEEITDPDVSMEDKRAELSRLAADYGFKDISVSDADGKTYNDTDISDRDYFQQAIKGTAYISSPVVRKTDNSIILFAAAKINNGTDYDGIVYAALDSGTFSSMVDEATIGKTGYSFILDKSGTVIADKNRENVNNFVNYIENSKKDDSEAGLARISEKMVGGGTGGQDYKAGSATYYAAYCPIPDTDGWSIATTVQQSEMLSDFYRTIVLTILILVIIIASSILVAVRIALPIVNPIAKLVSRIEGLAEGDLHSEVPVIQRLDEIGILSKTFADTVKTLNTYIGEIDSVVGKVSNGDLTAEASQDYKGDFVSIKTSLNKLSENLNATFHEISASADQVACGSDQVSSGAQALSQGATEQASSIEELSASIAEIADKAGKNAENSKKANEFSLQASNEVAKGSEHIRKMVAAMGEISDTSNEIGKIIKTIEDIAFQTNILSLNAAVEAAHAGEAGKGFSVVADEVRNLANKSAAAAKNTTALIENSIAAVDKGKKIADETAGALGAIIGSTKKTTDLIERISKDSNEQSASISQIKNGIDQISSVVQTNSATAEESAATSEELSGQARTLKQTLSNLKLRENGAKRG